MYMCAPAPAPQSALISNFESRPPVWCVCAYLYARAHVCMSNAYVHACAGVCAYVLLWARVYMRVLPDVGVYLWGVPPTPYLSLFETLSPDALFVCFTYANLGDFRSGWLQGSTVPHPPSLSPFRSAFANCALPSLYRA